MEIAERKTWEFEVPKWHFMNIGAGLCAVTEMAIAPEVILGMVKWKWIFVLMLSFWYFFPRKQSSRAAQCQLSIRIWTFLFDIFQSLSIFCKTCKCGLLRDCKSAGTDNSAKRLNGSIYKAFCHPLSPPWDWRPQCFLNSVADHNSLGHYGSIATSALYKYILFSPFDPLDHRCFLPDD